jgi:ABC-2 type transport system permease protein
MKAIFKREFKSYFSSPLGYIFLAIMIFFQGIFFLSVFSKGTPDITSVFSNTYFLMLILIPVLTMGSMSDDRRLKIDQALLTAPVSLTGIVLGKFFAIFSVFVLSYAPTLVFQIIFAVQKVSINWLIYIGNLLGVALLGATLIAIGVFISSLTESQLIAVVFTLACSVAIGLLDIAANLINFFASAINKFISVDFLTEVVDWFSFMGRYNAFGYGIIDYSNVLFFVGITAIFVFLTVRVLDKRRYS